MRRLPLALLLLASLSLPALAADFTPGRLLAIPVDPDLLRMNYISNVPTVMLDGSYISSGYVPTRSELETAIDRRQQALALSRSVFENTGDSRRWRR